MSLKYSPRAVIWNEHKGVRTIPLSGPPLPAAGFMCTMKVQAACIPGAQTRPVRAAVQARNRLREAELSPFYRIGKDIIYGKTECLEHL